jgi:TRAP-type mannitol/chloroaromatic compound transport system permease small subunit
MRKFLFFIDELSTWVGKAFAWLILVLTFALAYEVFVRYAMGAPTTWAFDISYMLYGAIFLMAAPYTLSVGGHVRGDMLYRLWPVRVQASVDLFLYLTVFFPTMLAMMYVGWDYAYYSFSLNESSASSPGGPSIWPLKMVIPAMAALMLLQGAAQLIRVIRALRSGSWQ